MDHIDVHHVLAQQQNKGTANHRYLQYIFDPYRYLAFFSLLCNRYKLCIVGTDGTAQAEFMLFGDIGQSVIGKHIAAVLRSNSGDTIPREIDQIVCNKISWHITMTEKELSRS